MWLGVRASRSLGSPDNFVMGRSFRMASTSHIPHHSRFAASSSGNLCWWVKQIMAILALERSSTLLSRSKQLTSLTFSDQKSRLSVAVWHLVNRQLLLGGELPFQLRVISSNIILQVINWPPFLWVPQKLRAFYPPSVGQQVIHFNSSWSFVCRILGGVNIPLLLDIRCSSNGSNHVRHKGVKSLAFIFYVF